jgi:DNA-binding SARP family transcriptional activator/tetratricopeptide (TPR) repeat protein
MEFRILGPLEVLRDGGMLELERKKERTLLVVLLLEANRVVSTDRLIEALWEGRPPQTASKALQVYVSKLRKLLGKDRVQTSPAGYMLCVEDGELDVELFQRLYGEGRHAEALSLWRGEPLADFSYQRFARSEQARLVELRLACLEDRIDGDLAAGRHAELVGELEGLVGEQPLRQRVRGQLMLALYRSGREAEALEAYQDGRRALVEELGVEPSRELREMQQAILNQDPSLDVVAERAPAGSERLFVGRESELEQLSAGLGDAVAGRGRLFLLVGEPGIGKSWLADELIGRARVRGARVLVGRCWEAGGAPAYWPWVQSLRAYIRETTPATLRQQLGAGAADLVHLLPELRELLPDLPARPALESESARFHLFEATSSFLRSAAKARPTILFLDDLHAADESSLLLLRFLARDLANSRLLVVGAYRDVDPTIREPLTGAIVELAGEPVTRRLELGGLRESEVAEYISRATDLAPDSTLVAEIHSRTEGNPLFVGEVTSLLLGEGAFATAAPATRIRVPQGVRDVIGRRLRRLSEDSRRVLTFASVLGREFPLDALARLSELQASAVLDVLDGAMAARVVEGVPAVPGRLRFAHVLMRDTLYEDLTPARRLRLHRQAGEVLEAMYADGLESHLAELARHFAEAAPAGDVDKAVSYARRAGERAADLLAFEEAARLYRLALQLTEADDLAGRSQRCELLIAFGDVQARAGDMPAARESFLHAAELADVIGSGELLAHAALGYGGRFVFTRATEDHRVVPLLEQAEEALGHQESPLRVRVLARLACALSQHASESSSALSAEALEIARRLEDPTTLAYAISGRLWATRAPTQLDERWLLTGELIQAGDKERAFEGHAIRVIVLLARGDIPSIRHELEIMEQLADELGQASQHWWIAAHGATVALLQGRFAAAETLINQARALGERAQSYDATAYYQLQRFALRREQNRLAETLTGLERTVEGDPGRPLLRCALALTYHQLGRADDGQRLFVKLAADDFNQLPVNNDWLLAASLLAELAASTQAAEQAAALYRRLAPYHRLTVDTYEVSTGAVSRYLGLLASTTSRWDQAARHFEHALNMNESIGARPWLAHTQTDYADLLLARDGRGDRQHAEALLAQATVTYSELGMTQRSPARSAAFP